ncbi:MAG: hypothetical protein ACFCAD_03180 [Pleurocapsa sp.]
MPKPSQAHLERTINRKDPIEDRQKTLNQMHYYMGAKLVEVRIDPQKVMYRWSVEDRGDLQTFTLSAFWGDSEKKILSGENPLKGEELVNCAKANASAGIKQAATLCGYASNLDSFRANLTKAIQEIELPEESFQKLLA